MMKAAATRETGAAVCSSATYAAVAEVRAASAFATHSSAPYSSFKSDSYLPVERGETL